MRPIVSWLLLFAANFMWALQFTCVKLVQDQVLIAPGLEQVPECLPREVFRFSVILWFSHPDGDIHGLVVACTCIHHKNDGHCTSFLWNIRYLFV